MNLFTPLPASRWPDDPIGRIMHQLDLARIYMREYRVDAIARHVQDPKGLPKVGFSFEQWKELKTAGPYFDFHLQNYRYLP